MVQIDNAQELLMDFLQQVLCLNNKKKIIGITCHNSIKLAKTAINHKADYIALGSFYASKTKKIRYRATTNILNSIKM